MFDFKNLKTEDLILFVLISVGLYMFFCNSKEYFQQMPNGTNFNYVKEGANKTAPRFNKLYKKPGESDNMNLNPKACGGNFLSADLLPKTDIVLDDKGFEFAPSDVQKAVEDNTQFLRREILVDTVGKTTKCLDLRKCPTIEKKWEGPFNYGTLDPDLYRKTLDFGIGMN